jgi:PAS domain S-box-containing protein
MTLSKPSERRAKWSFLLIFLLLAAGIVTLGYRYYRNYERQFRAAAEQQLLAIAELKVSELTRWREERMADGAIFYQNPSFSALVRRCLAQPADADAQRQLLDWLGKYPASKEFNQVRLLDTQGVSRMTIPAGRPPASSYILQQSQEVLLSGQIMFQDLYRSVLDQRIYLAVLVPIFDEADGNRPLGVLVLRIDPATYLYPFIKRWPTPSLTAETLLLRRDGNEILYLNDLRHLSNAALALRLSVARTDVPAVKAALGQTNSMLGMDYRGVPVLAAAQAVPDSPWFLEAKVDTAEVLAPMRKRLWQVVVMLGLLLFGAGAGVGLVWRQQRVRFYREQAATAETLRESQERFRKLFELSADLVCIADLEGRFRETNPAFCKVLGYPKEELVSRPFLDFVHPEDRDKTLQVTKEKLQQGKTVLHFENRYLCKDGGFVWLEWTSQPSVAMGVTFAIARDVTARKQAEAALRLKNMVFDVSIAANSVAGLDGVITEANDAFLLCWGYRSKDEVIGHPISYFLKDSNEAEAIVSALNEKGQWEGDLTAKKRDGSIFIAHTMATVVRNEDGKVTGYQSSIVDITKRKQAEAALREAEWKFRALFEQGPIGVAYHEMIYDPDGQPIDYRFLDANESYRELTGVDPRGKTVRQAFPGIENDPFDWIGTFGQVARTGVPIRFEQYLQANGRWYDCVGYQYQPDHFVAAFLNITARKQAEAAVHREQEFARTLLDNITDGVVACDAQGTLVLFNRTAREWHGMDALALPPEEWGRHYSLYGPDGAMPLPTKDIPLVRAFRGETIHDVGMTVIAQGQPPRHLLAAGCPFFDAQHNLLGAVVAMRDCTERKQMEAKLVTILKAVESTSDAVGISDAQGRHFFQNQALSNLFGYATAEELQAAGGGPIVVKDPAVAKEMFERITSGKSWAGELEMVTKSGRVFPAYERADAVLDNEGKVIGLIGIISDITVRKAAEAQLQLTLADLERSNQELEQFAYVASHDLQEPLRMVASYTQLLAQRYEGQLDAKANKYIHYAVDGALRMQALINDLLTYSRVGTQGQPLAPTDTQAVLGEALRNLTATIAESQAVITNANLPTVRADAAQLVLVFQNLLANAIKFRGQDLPRVHISAQERPGEWVFAVQDNGIGIAPQHAERVFVIFQRLHTREEYPGTGIGLAVCQRIVERHGGKIWFTSAPGNGSTFFFTVPK